MTKEEIWEKLATENINVDMEIIIYTKRIPPADEEFVFEKQTLRRDNYDFPA